MLSLSLVIRTFSLFFCFILVSHVPFFFLVFFLSFSFSSVIRLFFSASSVYIFSIFFTLVLHVCFFIFILSLLYIPYAFSCFLVFPPLFIPCFSHSFCVYFHLRDRLSFYASLIFSFAILCFSLQTFIFSIHFAFIFIFLFIFQPHLLFPSPHHLYFTSYVSLLPLIHAVSLLFHLSHPLSLSSAAPISSAPLHVTLYLRLTPFCISLPPFPRLYSSLLACAVSILSLPSLFLSTAFTLPRALPLPFSRPRFPVPAPYICKSGF